MTFNKKRLENLLANTADLSLKRKARKIIITLNPGSLDKILEVGTGDAYYPSILARLGNYYLVGLEIDKRVLDTAERNLKMLKIPYKRMKSWVKPKKKGVYLVEGDVLKMPFPGNFFDKVIASEVCEHLSDDLAGLKEIYRVLKPKGFVVISVPNWYYPFLWDPINWVLQKFFKTHIKSGFWAGIWNQHERLYSLQEIKDKVKKAGFRIDKAEVQTKWCLPFNHYLINLGARLLAAQALPRKIHSQVNKFEEVNRGKRFFLVDIYYKLAEFADSFNKESYPKVGTTIFLKATKPEGSSQLLP